MALSKAALLLFICVLKLSRITSYEVHTLDPCYADHTIWLGSQDKSALNFNLGNFKFDQQSPDSVFKCSFHIEADRDEKIIAVIQKMNLRGTDYNCLDYVEFSDTPKLSFTKLYDRLNNVKKQICGNKNVSIMSLPNDMVLHAFNKYTVPQNVYITNRNELKVKVVISKIPLKKDETLDFQIIFTAAKIGSECKDHSQFDCGNNTCIWRGFYKDGIVNCPYAACPDEDGCEAPIIKYSSGSGTTIIICAVASMLSVLGVFLLCLYICRRCKVLCWAHRSTSRDPSARVHVSSSHPNEPVQPSAPPLISLHDKDLPPSYDSLFPARIAEKEVCVVKDVDIEICKRSESVHETQNVRMEDGAMRYCRRGNSPDSGLHQNEVVPNSRSRGTGRRHPYNRPNNHERTHGRSNNNGQTRGRSSNRGRTHGRSSNHGQTHGRSSNHGQTHGHSSNHGQTHGHSSSHGQTHGRSNNHGQTHGRSNNHGQTHGRCVRNHRPYGSRRNPEEVSNGHRRRKSCDGNSREILNL